MSRNVLFICGSLNQTTMMHQIAQRLEGCNTFFTPFFADGPLSLLARTGLLNFTILGGRHRKNTLQYLRAHDLPIDYAGRGRHYDLIVTCTDLITQKIIRETPTVLVQEGIMEAEDWLFPLVKHLKLPRYLANTAATGLSDQYEVFCVASEGYRDDFIRKGVKAHKLIVTGWLPPAPARPLSLMIASTFSSRSNRLPTDGRSSSSSIRTKTKNGRSLRFNVCSLKRSS